MGINGIVLYIIIFTACVTCGIFIPKYSNTTFDSPKLAVMFIGVSVGCICWVIKGFENGICRKTKGVNLAILIYLFANIVSMVFSHNWVISFFGGNKQHGGVLSLLIYLAFFYLCANFINKKNVHIVFRYLIIFSVFCCIYGFCQKYNIIDFKDLPLSVSREVSTFGNPVFYGCFLVMMIPITLYQIVKTKKLYLYFVLLLLIVSVFITGTRSAILILLYISIPLVFIYKDVGNLRMMIVAIIAVVFIIACYYFAFNEVNLYGRFTAPGNYLIKLENYQFGFNTGLSYPFFGIGQDLIRSHNIFTDQFGKLGTIGFLSFCYLGYRSIITIFKNIKNEERNLLYTLIAICLSYVAYRLTNPDYISITLLFSMFAGMIYGVKNNNNYN